MSRGRLPPPLVGGRRVSIYYGALRAVDMDTRAAAAVGSAGGVTAVSPCSFLTFVLYIYFSAALLSLLAS